MDTPENLTDLEQIKWIGDKNKEMFSKEKRIQDNNNILTIHYLLLICTLINKNNLDITILQNQRLLLRKEEVGNQDIMAFIKIKNIIINGKSL